MKNYWVLLLIIIFLACTNKKAIKEDSYFNEDKEIIPAEEAEQEQEVAFLFEEIKPRDYSGIIKEWLDFYNINIDLFELVSQGSLQAISIPFDVDRFDFEDDIYLPLCKYSPDSSAILDFTSYHMLLEKNENGELVSLGNEVDTEVSISDIKAGIWMRILFLGSSYLIEDGFWVSNTEVVIVGQELIWQKDEEEYGKKPAIWFVDIEKDIEYYLLYDRLRFGFEDNYIEKVKYKNIIFNYGR